MHLQSVPIRGTSNANGLQVLCTAQGSGLLAAAAPQKPMKGGLEGFVMLGREWACVGGITEPRRPARDAWPAGAKAGGCFS